jgi:Transposase
LLQASRWVRVPPNLMAPERRGGRARGNSDPIDALAVARAALRQPRLDRPRPGEAALREPKLLVDHRDDLVDERRRAQQRLRWQLHDLDPQLAVPPGTLDRPLWFAPRERLTATDLTNIKASLAQVAACLVAASPGHHASGNRPCYDGPDTGLHPISRDLDGGTGRSVKRVLLAGWQRHAPDGLPEPPRS